MRRIFALTIALVAPACVDAPLTPAHLDADGQVHGARMAQGSFATATRSPAVEAVQITAVLAAQPTGPLADAAVFSSEQGEVYLHLRADRLTSARPVTFVWSHDEIREQIEGVLAPSTTLTMAASHRLSPEDRGAWRVEVLGEPLADGSRPLLFERDFEVLAPQ
ncbi:MAG: hypothetical protein IPK80_11725 [Nannocystis sp.]|nr:hypothetical protein [Nannocystis sp.]